MTARVITKVTAGVAVKVTVRVVVKITTRVAARMAAKLAAKIAVRVATRVATKIITREATRVAVKAVSFKKKRGLSRPGSLWQNFENFYAILNEEESSIYHDYSGLRFSDTTERIVVRI